MIDFHTHILPQIDDGSASPEETAALLDMLWQQGVTTAVATPHYYATRETPEAFLQRRDAAIARMLPTTESQPQVLLGAEIAYFSGISCCEEIIPLRIENTKLLLVEMPYATWSESMVEEICQIPVRLGLTPVLAHVNRYKSRKQFPDHQDYLMENGVLFQWNADAFCKPRYRRWALQMLKKGYVHCIGSDCHDLSNRPPQLDLAQAAIEKKMGPESFRQLNSAVEDLIFSK